LGSYHVYRTIASVNGRTYKYELTKDVYNKTYFKKSIYHVLEYLTGIHLPWGVLTGIRPSKIVREYKKSGYSSLDAKKYLTDFFETDENKADIAVKVEKNETRITDYMSHDGISLYIGIPFCPTRCLYCSFTSQSIDFSNKLTVPYVEALKYEIRKISENPYIRKRKIETIYFGGGTPSALNEEQIYDILNTLYKSFDLSYIKEITFEAGRPDTITKEKLEILKRFSISRISINPQTSSDKTLEIIGRKHTNKKFLDSFRLAKSLGFSHINCDVIAGLPDETIYDFQNTMNELISE